MQTDWLQVNDICYVYKCALGAITKRTADDCWTLYKGLHCVTCL